MRVPSRLKLADTSFEAREFSRLWVIATATYGVGDMVTTIALLKFSARVEEANLLLRSVVAEFGQAGLIGLKLAVFLACIAVSVDAAHREDPLIYYLPPTALAFVGTFTTIYNIRLLMG